MDVANHNNLVKHATAEFDARYKVNGRLYWLQEVSCFVCEEGRWFCVNNGVESLLYKPWYVPYYCFRYFELVRGTNYEPVPAFHGF
jgi:uncharacterized protein YchJ